MSRYEKQYEEYKKELLGKRWFVEKLHDIYEKTIRVEKEYIDQNGVLWKVAVLSGVCGACWWAFSMLEESATTGSIIIRIITFIVGIICFCAAMYIGAKFKETMAIANFYSYKYRQCLVKHVSEEKQRETDALLRDVKDYHFTVKWYLKDIESMSEEDIKYLYISHANMLDELKVRIDNLERYNYFITCIEDDYYFDAEMLKGIEKYNRYNK